MKKMSTLALALLVAGAAWASQTKERTLDVRPDVTVEVENVAGEVQVESWDRNQVRVSAVYGEDVEEVSIEGGNGRVVVEVKLPDWHGSRRRDIEADIEIMMPRGGSLEVETVSASIDVSGLAGSLELESVSGGIEVEGNPESADLESVSGSIRFRGSGSRVSAESVSGSVTLDGVADRVEASTVSGSVRVTAGQVNRTELESVSGSIDFEGKLSASARFSVSSHSGTIEVTLPADTSATFEVSTFSGNIDNDWGQSAHRTSRYVPSKSLDFTVGSGSAEVTVETFSGNVRLRKR